MNKNMHFDGKNIVQPYNPQPDKKVYAISKHPVERQSVGYLMTKVEYPEEGGIYIHYKDIPYPKKGYPTLQVCESLNIMKKITMLVFSNPWLLLSKKNVERYIGTVYWVMDNPFKAYLKDDRSDWYEDRYYCTFAQEFKKLLEVFFKGIGVDVRMAKIFAHIMQDDDAYRYRVQDTFNETTLEKMLDNPRKEISRLMKLSISREGRPTYDLMQAVLQEDYNYRKTSKIDDGDKRLSSNFKHLLGPQNPLAPQVNGLYNEMSSEKLMAENPRRELKKFLNASYKREGSPVSNKTMKFAGLLLYSLLIPKYNKSFKAALREVDFKKLQLDESDKYNCLRPGYDFMGMKVHDREKALTQIHKGVLPFATILK